MLNLTVNRENVYHLLREIMGRIENVAKSIKSVFATIDWLVEHQARRQRAEREMQQKFESMYQWFLDYKVSN